MNVDAVHRQSSQMGRGGIKSNPQRDRTYVTESTITRLEVRWRLGDRAAYALRYLLTVPKSVMVAERGLPSRRAESIGDTCTAQVLISPSGSDLDIVRARFIAKLVLRILFRGYGTQGEG